MPHDRQPSTREAALDIAERVVAGTTRPLLGARRLCSLLDCLGWEDDPRFIVLQGVDSESDHLPLDAAQRNGWNAEALERKDAKAAEYELRVATEIVDACKAIIIELRTAP